jgi:nitrate reductase delta subunit
MALVHFKEVYATEGWSSTGEELDDFLPILLEFIAVTDSPLGLNILQEHRAGIKLLEIALRDMKSPYQRLVEAIFNKIPGKETQLTLKLIQEGPPIETVGLAPYGENRSDKKNVGMTC